MTWSRRAFVSGAAALAACPHVPGGAAPAGPIVLGWRLVPGMTRTWRTVLTHQTGLTRTRRAEEWTYAVRALHDDGSVTLDGVLTAFGAGIEIDGTPLPEDSLRPARATETARLGAGVTLRLGTDGRVMSCSARGFEDGVPHRMLALALPAHPVQVDDAWRDNATMRPFADLLPLDLDVATDGLAELTELITERGRLLAAIRTTGEVRAPDGPGIALTGTARFDLAAGLLAHRKVEARFVTPSPEADDDPGVLTVEVFEG